MNRGVLCIVRSFRNAVAAAAVSKERWTLAVSSPVSASSSISCCRCCCCSFNDIVVVASSGRCGDGGAGLKFGHRANTLETITLPHFHSSSFRDHAHSMYQNAESCWFRRNPAGVPDSYLGFVLLLSVCLLSVLCSGKWNRAKPMFVWFEWDLRIYKKMFFSETVWITTKTTWILQQSNCTILLP